MQWSRSGYATTRRRGDDSEVSWPAVRKCPIGERSKHEACRRQDQSRMPSDRVLRGESPNSSKRAADAEAEAEGGSGEESSKGGRGGGGISRRMRAVSVVVGWARDRDQGSPARPPRGGVEGGARANSAIAHALASPCLPVSAPAPALACAPVRQAALGSRSPRTPAPKRHIDLQRRGGGRVLRRDKHAAPHDHACSLSASAGSASDPPDPQASCSPPARRCSSCSKAPPSPPPFLPLPPLPPPPPPHARTHAHSLARTRQQQSKQPRLCFMHYSRTGTD